MDKIGSCLCSGTAGAGGCCARLLYVLVTVRILAVLYGGSSDVGI